MITGFNTDIEYEGVTYHVQTEDKGMDTPLILSLVYDRGTILASKRSPYNDLLIGEFSEEELMERLRRQHKLICAAISAGRIDDLKRMTMKESASKKQGLIAQKEVKLPEKPSLPIPTLPIPKPENLPLPVAVLEKSDSEVRLRKEEVPMPQILTEETGPVKEFKQPAVTLQSALPSETEELLKTERELQALEEVWDIPISLVEDDLIFDEDEVEIIEEVMILPQEAVEIITDFARNDEPADDGLALEILNDVKFRGGESKTISVLVSRDKGRVNVAGVNVMIKILGSAFRPLIFHARTDSNGVAIVQLQLPSFSRGRAAILVKAISGTEETELRRVIQPG